MLQDSYTHDNGAVLNLHAIVTIGIQDKDTTNFNPDKSIMTLKEGYLGACKYLRITINVTMFKQNAYFNSGYCPWGS